MSCSGRPARNQLLNISWRPLAIRALLADGNHVSAALAAINADLDLWNAGPEDRQPAAVPRRPAWSRPGDASKLLARKRPRLVPVHDEIVLRVLAPPKEQL
ncbi:DUF6308 family protein [Micromonospora sp. ZYX-F-536]|uniref:DUF6308 family protein n=1 Tax=Micromonospora sp. ZYX-F-536 TaxID=3457629 RepID=UPI0040408422